MQFKIGDIVKIHLKGNYDESLRIQYDGIVARVTDVLDGDVDRAIITYKPPDATSYEVGHSCGIDACHWVLASKLSTFKFTEDVIL